MSKRSTGRSAGAGHRAHALAALLLLLALDPTAPRTAEVAGSSGPPATSTHAASAPAGQDAGGDESAPLLAPARAPAADAVREGRGEPPPRPPSRRLPHFALAPALDPPAAHWQAIRPADGIDVPACRSAGRWCLAHATSTSPA